MRNTFDKSFDNYLEDCKQNKHMKCAIVATDKQCVVLKEQDSKECNSHNDLALHIENMIHPNNQAIGWEAYHTNNAYIFLEGPELTANLPLDGNLSTTQAAFLLDILKKVCEFNLENSDMMSMDIITNTDYKQYHSHNFNPICNYILSLITEEYVTEDEKIIGKTYDSELTPEKMAKIYKKVI